MNEPTIYGETYEYGCYVDGHWGQYGASRVIRLSDDIVATEYFKAATLQGASTGIMTDELEFDDIVAEWSDRAEDALNKVTKNGVWHWYEGEFFLGDPEKLDEENANEYT